MSEATITAVLTQAPAIILALGTLLTAAAGVYLALRNAKRTETVKNLATDTKNTAAVILEKTETVLQQTNGSSHAQAAALEAALKKIDGLEKMIRRASHPRIKPLTKVK